MVLTPRLKVAIIGLGKVGATIAFTLLFQGFADTIFLVSRDEKRAWGEKYDLLHAQAFLNHQTKIVTLPLEEVTESDLIILTASIPVVNMTSRLELLEGNVTLFKSIIPPLARQNPQAIFIVITNPVDIMTYLTVKLSGFPSSRVIGTGTLIESGRFRSLIGLYSGIHPGDVHAYLLGEHGEETFPVFSSAQVGGKKLTRTLPVCRRECPRKTIQEVFEEAKGGGMEVYHHKGYTNYAISLACLTLIEAIVKDSGKILPVSTLLEGQYGIHGVCLSLPAVIGREGILKTLDLDLTPEEIQALYRAKDKLLAIIRSLGEYESLGGDIAR